MIPKRACSIVIVNWTSAKYVCALTDALDVLAGLDHFGGDVIIIDTGGFRVDAPVLGQQR